MKPALHAIIGVLLVAFSASLPLGCDSEKADSKRSEKERKKAADDDEDDAPAKKDKKSAAAKSSDAPPVASPPGSEAPPKATVPTITGSYNVSGTNPNGSAYRGTLEVKDREKVLQFVWSSGGTQYDGVGIQLADTVGVAFASGKDGTGCSVIQYQFTSKGDAVGRWGAWGKNESAVEVVSDPVAGTAAENTYKVAGTRLDGATYKGTLTLKQQGAGYAFKWDTGDKSEGFGIRWGDFATVGIGGAQCGFVSYQVKPDGSLDGKWSSAGSPKLGTELAKKR